MPPKKYKLPIELPDGWILTDSEKKKWRIGKIIGKGGFGLIYLASVDINVPVQNDTDYVIKVEYHENGPLFSELKFYQRAAKPDTMSKWKKCKCMEFLGIPTYWGSGLSEYKGTRYRFMVMDRLGKDLQKVLEENGGQLRKPTVLQLGILMLDVLEYIHDNEYVHADIKAANLLLGHRDANKVYLADYGLSYRYCPNGQHKEYKENPKKGHNGTIEYTSIDAHKGVVPSRRGDLEVLGYCLLHWQCGTLPWLSYLRNPAEVQEAKAKLMANLPDSVRRMSNSSSTTEEIASFLLCVKHLDYNEKPDYQSLRKVLSRSALQGPLDLSRLRASETSRPATQPRPYSVNTAARKGSSRQRPMFRESDEDCTDDEEESLPPRAHPKTRAGARQTQTVQQERRKADLHGEARVTERRKKNSEHQYGYSGRLNDDQSEPSRENDYRGDYSRKYSRNYNRWEEPDYPEDHWSVCEQKNEWTHDSHFGKPDNSAIWGIRSSKEKWILILFFVVILTAVGFVLRLRRFQ